MKRKATSFQAKNSPMETTKNKRIASCNNILYFKLFSFPELNRSKSNKLGTAHVGASPKAQNMGCFFWKFVAFSTKKTYNHVFSGKKCVLFSEFFRKVSKRWKFNKGALWYAICFPRKSLGQTSLVFCFWGKFFGLCRELGTMMNFWDEGFPFLDCNPRILALHWMGTLKIFWSAHFEHIVVFQKIKRKASVRAGNFLIKAMTKNVYMIAVKSWMTCKGVLPFFQYNSLLFNVTSMLTKTPFLMSFHGSADSDDLWGSFELVSYRTLKNTRTPKNNFSRIVLFVFGSRIFLFLLVLFKQLRKRRHIKCHLLFWDMNDIPGKTFVENIVQRIGQQELPFTQRSET